MKREKTNSQYWGKGNANTNYSILSKNSAYACIKVYTCQPLTSTYSGLPELPFLGGAGADFWSGSGSYSYSKYFIFTGL